MGKLDIQMILDIATAVMGLVIIILLITIAARSKKKDKTKKQVIAEIVKNNDSAQDDMDQFVELYAKFSSMNSNGNQDLQMMLDSLQATLKKYSELEGHAMEVYQLLLRNEDKTYISYGYERFIDAFRTYLGTEGYYTCQAQYDELKNYVTEKKKYRSSDSPEELASFSNKCLPALNDMYKAVLKLIPFSTELSLKYSTSDKKAEE